MPASGTVNALLFPPSLRPAGDHFSTRSAARKRNLLRDTVADQERE